MRLHQIKNALQSKENTYQSERQPIEWENLYQLLTKGPNIPINK
jgi:hypothetical protein